jgi:hypothetical protein
VTLYAMDTMRLMCSGSVNRLNMYSWLSLSSEDADDVGTAFYLHRDVIETVEITWDIG